MSAEQVDAAHRSRTVVEATLDGKTYRGKVVTVVREPSFVLERAPGDYVIVPVEADVRPPGRVS